MSLLERLLFLFLALLAVAALVGLIGHDIGRNATPSSAVGAGRFWW
jgi:hypothetical protein